MRDRGILNSMIILLFFFSFQTYKMHLPQIWSLRYNWKARCPLLIGYKHHFWKDLRIPMVLADYFGCFDCLLLDLHDSCYCCPFYTQNHAPGTYLHTVWTVNDVKRRKPTKSPIKDLLGYFSISLGLHGGFLVCTFISIKNDGGFLLWYHWRSSLYIYIRTFV